MIRAAPFSAGRNSVLPASRRKNVYVPSGAERTGPGRGGESGGSGRNAIARDRGTAGIVVAATALRKREAAAAAAPGRDGGSGGGLTIDGVVALPDTATLNCKRMVGRNGKDRRGNAGQQRQQQEAGVCAERGPVAGLGANMREA